LGWQKPIQSFKHDDNETAGLQLAEATGILSKLQKLQRSSWWLLMSAED
jgi:hypothetical protein